MDWRANLKQVIIRHFVIPAFLLIILFCALAHSETKCVDKNEIICHTVCQQDNDDLGIIIKGKCYCANERNMSKTPFKLDSRMRTNVQEIRKIYWSWE